MELAAFVRAEFASPPSMMVITGTGGAADWQVLHGLGVTGFHIKPIAPDVLVHALRRALDPGSA